MAIPKSTSELMAVLAELHSAADHIAKLGDALHEQWGSDEMVKRMPEKIALAVRSRGASGEAASLAEDELRSAFLSIRAHIEDIIRAAATLDRTEGRATAALDDAARAAAEAATEQLFTI